MGFSSARMKAGLSQRAVAEKMNVSPAAVALWDTGKSKPRAALLPKLAELYGCTVDELLSDQEHDQSTA